MEEKNLKLLEDLKKLTILDLISRGVQAKDIARVLNVDPAVISRMVPAKKIKKSL